MADPRRRRNRLGGLGNQRRAQPPLKCQNLCSTYQLIKLEQDAKLRDNEDDECHPDVECNTRPDICQLSVMVPGVVSNDSLDIALVRKSPGEAAKIRSSSVSLHNLQRSRRYLVGAGFRPKVSARR